MVSSVAARFSRAPVFRALTNRRFSSSPTSGELAERPSRNNASPPTSSAPQAEVPFAPSFVAPLPIPGIRRAPRTPTLPADSKFVKYSGAVYDRMFPFVLTASFLLPLGLVVRYF